MADTAEKSESEILRALRSRHEKDGYTFIIQPTMELVPDFLKGYQPDAVALSDKGSVVIEIKGTRSPSGERSLSQLAERIAKHPNWRLEVFYAGNFHVPIYQKPDKAEIHKLLEEIKTLRQSGFKRPAFVMGWAALEGLARALASDNDKILRPRIPSEIIEWLAQSGHIDSETSRRLRDMIRTRSELVHGVPNAEIRPGDFTVLWTTLQSLAQELDPHP